MEDRTAVLEQQLQQQQIMFAEMQTTMANMATKEDLQRVATAAKEDLQKAVLVTKEELHKASLATKEDLHKATMATKEDFNALERKMDDRMIGFNKQLIEQTWRYFISTTTLCTLLTGIVYYIARNVH
ncbi:hypothetical protein ACLB1G_26570 [Oxalobacteraceae bacterium A2-2]